MKNKKTVYPVAKRNFFAPVISLIYIATVLTFAVSMLVEYKKAPARIQARVDELVRATTQNLSVNQAGSDQFTTALLHSIGPVSDIAGIQLSQNGCLIFSYPADLAENSPTRSPFVTVTEHSLYARNQDAVQMKIASYLIEPSSMYTRTLIAFFIILAATLFCITYLICLYASEKEGSGSDYDDEIIADDHRKIEKDLAFNPPKAEGIIDIEYGTEPDDDYIEPAMAETDRVFDERTVFSDGDAADSGYAEFEGPELDEPDFDGLDDFEEPADFKDPEFDEPADFDGLKKDFSKPVDDSAEPGFNEHADFEEPGDEPEKTADFKETDDLKEPGNVSAEPENDFAGQDSSGGPYDFKRQDNPEEPEDVSREIEDDFTEQDNPEKLNDFDGPEDDFEDAVKFNEEPEAGGDTEGEPIPDFDAAETGDMEEEAFMQDFPMPRSPASTITQEEFQALTQDLLDEPVPDEENDDGKSAEDEESGDRLVLISDGDDEEYGGFSQEPDADNGPKIRTSLDEPVIEEQEALSADKSADEEEGQARHPAGLFSPATGFGWEEYMIPRLDSELIRAASGDQDLTVMTLEIPKMDWTSDAAKEICGLIMDLAKFRDLVFEYGGSGCTAIIQNMGIEEALSAAEDLHTNIIASLARRRQYYTVAIGLSARSLRLISGSRIAKESEQALIHALEDKSRPVVAFKVNPERYRNYIAAESAKLNETEEDGNTASQA